MTAHPIPAALRAATRLVDQVDQARILRIEVHDHSGLFIQVGARLGSADDQRDTDTVEGLAEVAGQLDTVTKLAGNYCLPYWQARVHGRMDGIAVEIVGCLTSDLDEVLAPLRALIPAEPAADPDAEIRRLAELSAAGQEHRTGGAL